MRARISSRSLAAPATRNQCTQSLLCIHNARSLRVALALAKTGDIEAAWREIAKAPLDCYFCLRVRGQIAAMQKNWNGAGVLVRAAP